MVRLRQALRGQCGRPCPAPTTAALNILPSRVTAAQSKASSSTSQWTAFKSRLDSNLNIVIPGSFEGGNWVYAADYALGYQCLKGTDPTTAAKYADKAVALLTWASTDYQTNADQSGWYFLARGDGVTTTFALPSTPTASFQVAKVPVTVKTMTRGGTANGQDQLSSDVYTFLKVSNTSDGTADYAKGTDWAQAGQYRNDFIDWSPAGAEPASGATYYITVASLSSAAHLVLSSGFTQSGTTLTFTSAPLTTDAIVVNYLWNDGTNAYRQTSNGVGGFNNILIDSSFTARYLAYLICAYDWLYDYAGFGSGLKATLEDFFVRWSDWTAGQSLSATTPTQPSGTTLPFKPLGLENFQSNYAAGFWALRCAAAVALTGRNANASRLQTDCTSYRTSYLARDWSAAAGANQFGSYLGGWDVEGWGDYNPLAVAGWLRGSDVLADAGLIADISTEQTFAGQVVKCYVHSLMQIASPGAVYSGGDFGAYPAGLYPRNLLAVPGFLSSDANASAYAAYYCANVTAAPLTTDSFDLLYRDPTATATNWTATEPLSYYASGSGLVLSRAAWDYASTVYSLELSDKCIAGHNTHSDGTVMAWRGADALLVPATEFVASEDVNAKLANGNVVMIGTTQDVNNQGPSHHTLIKAQEGTSAYTYAEGDYLNAYYNGSTNPATECTRAWLHVRPDYLFVYDRASVVSSATPMELRWYLSTAPTVTGDGWVTATRGSSKLFGHTYSSTTLTTVADTPSVAGTPVNRVKVNASLAQTTIRYASVLQTAPSATAAMDASAFVTSTAGAAMEGVLIGTVLVLFGKTATAAGATGYQVTTPTTYGYTAPGGTLTHYVCDLTSNQTYTLSGAAMGTVTASAAGVATFTTTGSGSQTVTIT